MLEAKVGACSAFRIRVSTTIEAIEVELLLADS
jgi:hypothetical protein